MLSASGLVFIQILYDIIDIFSVGNSKNGKNYIKSNLTKFYIKLLLKWWLIWGIIILSKVTVVTFDRELYTKFRQVIKLHENIRVL